MAATLASLVISALGCGSEAQPPRPAEASSNTKAASPYVEVLLEFRSAAESNATFDAYGYFESDYPASQKAALDGFCVVVNGVRTSSESEMLSDPAYFSSRVMHAAKPVAEAAPMASVRRAVGKLQSVIEPESLGPALVKGYAKACY